LQPSQLSDLSYTPSQSQYKDPPPHRFIWDEEDDSVPVVPDSQDLPGSSSYKPSYTPTSKSAATARPNTGTNTPSDLATTGSLPQSSTVSPGPAGLSYRHSEPPSYPSRPSDFVESEAISSRVDGSERISSIGGRQSSTSSERSQDSHILRNSSNPGPLEDLIHLTSSSSNPGTSNSPFSTDLPISSEEHSPHGRWSQAAAHTLSQLQSHPPSHSVSDESGSQSKTQLPLSLEGGNNSQIAGIHVTHRQVCSSLKLRSFFSFCI
jgi:hypothetical protein